MTSSSYHTPKLQSRERLLPAGMIREGFVKEVAFEEGPDKGIRTEEESFSGKINNVNQDTDVEKGMGGRPGE